MAGVVYAERFGGTREARAYRQARRCGVAVITHEHRDPEAYPYPHVQVLPRRWTLADVAIGAVRRLRFGHARLLPFSCAIKVGERLLERGATVVHAHRGTAGAAITLLARRLDCRLLVTFRGEDACDLPETDPGYRRALRYLFDRADRVLAASRVVFEKLAERGCPEGKLELLPFGVAIRPLRPRRAENRETVRAVCIAPLHPSQGIAEAVDAVALARRMGAPLELDIVGDGPERQNVEQRVQREDVAGLVRLHGSMKVDDALEIMERADFFLHNGRPAHRDDEEGPPEPVLRAMGAGLCVVATRHGGIPDAVREEVTGVLLETNDVPNLAAKLVEVARDPALRVALGAAARTLVERDFNAERAVERLKELYA